VAVYLSEAEEGAGYGGWVLLGRRRGLVSGRSEEKGVGKVGRMGRTEGTGKGEKEFE
jgi:hypothetical protein